MKTETHAFLVNGKTFHCDSDLHESNSFEVKSSPRPYQVIWSESEHPFVEINRILAENKNNYLLIDKKILELYGEHLQVEKERVFSADATENFKTLDGVTAVLDCLSQRGFTKGETMVVVGGGIIQDVGAFVGACYKRGIPWVYFPTTLLSMCDSCIGGKTGINYKDAKNQLALFSSPAKVIINPLFIASLPEEFIRSGLGEILKLYVMAGKNFLLNYKRLVSKGRVLNAADYKTLILGALSIKRAIIEEDEFELNYRRSLNYGHTLGHAIEALSQYAIPHGIAVVMGMVMVNEMGVQQGLMDANTKNELNVLCCDLIDGAMLACVSKLSMDNILSMLKKDKKTQSHVATFVMMKKPGDAHFIKIPIDYVLQIQIAESMKWTHQYA